MVRTVLLWTAIIGLILLGTMHCASVNTAECTNDVEYYSSYMVGDETVTERVCLEDDIPFVKNIKTMFKDDGKIYRVWYGLSVINFWFEFFDPEKGCLVVSTLFQTEEDFEIAMGPNWGEAKVDYTATLYCDFMDEMLAESLAK